MEGGLRKGGGGEGGTEGRRIVEGEREVGLRKGEGGKGRKEG